MYRHHSLDLELIGYAHVNYIFHKIIIRNRILKVMTLLLALSILDLKIYLEPQKIVNSITRRMYFLTNIIAYFKIV